MSNPNNPFNVRVGDTVRLTESYKSELRRAGLLASHDDNTGYVHSAIHGDVVEVTWRACNVSGNEYQRMIHTANLQHNTLDGRRELDAAERKCLGLDLPPERNRFINSHSVE